jgi:hypothetical protein
LNIFTPSLSTTNRTHYFTTAVQGTYGFKFSGSFYTINSSLPLYLNIALKDLDDGTIYANTYGLIVFGSTTPTEYNELYFTATIPAGRRVGVFYSRALAGNTNAYLVVLRTKWELYTSPILSTSQQVLVQDNLPGEVSCLDFFRGIVSLFNLVVIPDGDRNFKIEKWDTYFSSGDVKDWIMVGNLNGGVVLVP